MNNQEFVHFRWGVHDNHAEPFYALIDPSGSKFFLVDQNIKLIKLVQMIFLSSRHLITAKISSVKNYEPTLIDNSVALDWGLKTPYGGPYTFTGNGGFWQIRRSDDLYNWKNKITEYDLNLQKNIFLVIALLNSADDFVRHELDRVDDSGHYNHLLEFVKIVMPEDNNVVDLISVDLNTIQQLKARIKNCKQDLIRMLSAITLTQDYSTVTEIITNQFNEQENLSDIKAAFRTQILNTINKS